MRRGLSPNEFAKRDGCSRALVRRGIAQGKLIAFDDGSIDASLIGTPWRKRALGRKSAKTGEKPAKTTQKPPNLANTVNSLESYAEAQRRKENYLARLRQLEFEVKSGRLVDAATVRKRVFGLAREDREALTGWPAQVAPLIAAEIGADQVKLAVALDLHVRKFLAERTQLHRGGEPGD